MIVKYLINGQLKETQFSNEDVTYSVSTTNNRTTATIMAHKDIELVEVSETHRQKYAESDFIFANGYQSWTDSFEYGVREKLNDVRRLPKGLVKKFAFDSYGDAYFYKYNKHVIHGWDFGYVKGSYPVFVGNLNYKNAYLIVQFHKEDKKICLVSDVKNIRIKANEAAVVLDYIMSNDVELGQKIYFDNIKKPEAKKIFGYTSWYNHYQDINEQKMLTALDAASPDFDLFQIDDGFEEFVGDWLLIDKKKFPNGLKPIVEKIHEKGFKAGVWLAPFVAEEKSTLFRTHPDWIRKDKDGNYIKAGANWSGFYALDIEKEEVISYIKEFLTYYLELGFDFFKLDFLYAVSLDSYEGKSRAQVTQAAYELLRQVLGDKLILGCGAIISNCFGNFDYLRIGPDVSLIFDDVWYMRKMHRERISSKVTLRNTMYRHFFDGKGFLNDPDVFLLRDDNIKLSWNQRVALTTINALFGSLLMTSDNPKDYNESQLKMLATARNLFEKGEVKSVETLSGKIKVVYQIDGAEKSFVYNINKGTIKE